MVCMQEATVSTTTNDASQPPAPGAVPPQKPGKLLRCPQEGCDKVFRSSPGYRYHLKSHALDPRPHLCQVCHKKFKSANGLKYHLRKAHHIEPVLSKHNNNGDMHSMKEHLARQESISSEDDPFSNGLYQRQMSRDYSRAGSSSSRPSLTSPIGKSPMGFLSPGTRNLPGIPSPLIKSPMDSMGSCMGSSSSTGSGIQSPYNKSADPYFDKRFDNDYSKRMSYHRQSPSDNYRSSLSEYTQQCSQANIELRQQCQRLSTDDISPQEIHGRNSVSSKYYNCMKDGPQNMSQPNYSSDYRRPSYSYQTGLDNSVGHYGATPRDDMRYNSNRDYEPSEGKEYPSNLMSCHSTYRKASYDQCTVNSSSALFDTVRQSGDSPYFKLPNNVQNTEQIVPDITVPNQTSPSNSSEVCDRNNNNSRTSMRKMSESSNETEFSDCVFNENNLSRSPARASSGDRHLQNNSPHVIKREENNLAKSTINYLPTKMKSEEIKTEQVDDERDTLPDSTTGVSSSRQDHSNEDPILSSCAVTSNVPLLSRRTSRTKSIPPLFIKANPDGVSETTTTSGGKAVNSKLLHLAELATSPHSPYRNSPLPLSLTPSLLQSNGGTPDWTQKSPFSKICFSENKYLSTPTLTQSGDVSKSETFLENVQTPLFLTNQQWPTAVWLCFLKGCYVKFEQDDKAFRKTEDIAVFCTTPGGRRRDDMNFYTSGMKIRKMTEEPKYPRDMVVLTFEQIIPGPQKLIAKCPADHPLHVKNKGWSAFSPTDAMARYGIPFKKLAVNDICLPAPRMNQTPTTTVSPSSASKLSKEAQIFTFSTQDTSRFSMSKKPTDPSKPSDLSSNNDGSVKPLQQTNRMSTIHEKVAAASLLTSRSQDTITLTYSKSPKPPPNAAGAFFPPRDPTPPVQSELRQTEPRQQESRFPADSPSSETPDVTSSTAAPAVKKKRRKPANENEQSRRPMNGFMLFGKSQRVELTKSHPGKDNRAISKLLGEKWRELTEQGREEYSRQAKDMADERMKVNPNCWKRKHRKDKSDTNTQTTTEAPEAKKAKNENSMTVPKFPTFVKPDECYIKQEP